MEILNTYLPLLIESYKRRNFKPFTVVNGIWHKKQDDALQLLTDNYTKRFAFGGAAGPGKSWIGCTWEFMECLCYPGVRYFIGREELKRLRESTLQTFFKVARAYGAVSGLHYKYNGQDHYIEFANGSRIDLLDLKFLPSDPLFERYGSTEYTGGWIEEAGETHPGAYDTLKTRIGRQYNREYNLLGKLLLTLNPKKNWVYNEYYKPYKEGTLPEGVVFMPALVTDNPFIDPRYIDNLHAITDKVRKQRLLYGNFEYDDDDNSLLDYDSIQDLFTNSGALAGEKYITADIARFGRDSTIIMIWDGWRVNHIFKLIHKKIPEIAKFIAEQALLRKIKMSNIVVDDDGVGGGCTDILNCKPFVNNSSPLPNPKTSAAQNYKNLKTQRYYLLIEKIKEGGIYVETESEEVKNMLTEELEQVKKLHADEDGKLQIVPKEVIKELIGRSPDYSDTLMMRMYFELKQVKQYRAIII